MIYSCRQVDENGNKIFFFINDATSVTYDFESNFLDVDSIRHVYLSCMYYDKLSEDIKDGVGISLYNTGEKEVEVTCSGSVIEVTFYYKNGNKKSSNMLPSGCESCGVEGSTWWENGNLQRKGNTYWYENGQIKYEIGVAMPDGHCKAASYYESGQIKKLVICEYGYPDCFEVPWWNMDYCNGTEECFNKKGKKIECK